jgi:hypothetical protein
VTRFSSLNDSHNQVLQRQLPTCYHQCTMCAIIFNCDCTLYSHHRSDINNQCENPFYYYQENGSDKSDFRIRSDRGSGGNSPIDPFIFSLWGCKKFSLLDACHFLLFQVPYSGYYLMKIPYLVLLYCIFHTSYFPFLPTCIIISRPSQDRNLPLIISQSSLDDRAHSSNLFS